MCIHNETMNELECLLSPSHHAFDGVTPDEALSRFFKNLKRDTENIKGIEKETYKYLDDPSQDEQRISFDIWGASSLTDSLFVFIHGGYWKYGDKTHVSPLVKTLLDANIAVASVGYIYAGPDRTLMDLARDCAKAVDKILTIFPRFTRVVVSGHSAGGHLAYKCVPLMKSTKVTGVLPIAGAFDLREVWQDTYIGKEISLTQKDAEEATCTGDEYKDTKQCEFLFTVGDSEAPKLYEMNVAMQEKMIKKGFKSKIEILPGVDHMTLLDQTSNPESPMAKIIIDFCKNHKVL